MSLHNTTTVGEVQRILNTGTSIESGDNDGRKPLHIAAYHGRLEIVKYLLEKGASIEAEDKDGQKPLHMAAANGQLEIVKYLLGKGASIEAEGNIGKKPLHSAAFLGQLEIVRYLLEKGASTYNVKLKDDLLIHLMATDIMDLEEKHVDDYLKEDPMNMVILDGNNPLFTNVDALSSHMEDSVVFACKTVGYYGSSNVEHTKELFNPRKLGFVSGYIENDSIRKAMRLTVLENKRIYRLSGSIRKIPAVVSQLVYEGRTGLVSANHCQAGADGDVRTIDVVDVDNIPVVPFVENEITGIDLSMIVLARTIEKHSTISSDLALKIGTQVSQSWDAISDTEMTGRFQPDIIIGSLVILPGTDMNLLQKMCRIFNPTISSVTFKMKEVEDFSFLGDINGLVRFSACVRVNDRSVFQYLSNHSETLEVLSMPVHRDMMDLTRFVKLERIHLRDFDHSSGIIESIGKAPNVKQVDLEAKDFNGSLDGLVSTNDSMEKLTLKFARFKESIVPITSLNNLKELKMHLPIFDSGLSVLSSMNGLTSLRLTTNSLVSVDTSSMKLKILCIDQPE